MFLNIMREFDLLNEVSIMKLVECLFIIIDKFVILYLILDFFLVE